MKYVLLILFCSVLYAGEKEFPAHDSAPESIAQQQFNQMFVKVIVPVTVFTPKQDGPIVESWVTEQLKQLGESEYFAITDWVPVGDVRLDDDKADHHGWHIPLNGKVRFCPVRGNIPERKNGRVLVSFDGWAPVHGYEAKVTLADEPGTRAVEPVLEYSGSGEKKQVQREKPLAYVAVLIGPPPEKKKSP